AGLMFRSVNFWRPSLAVSFGLNHLVNYAYDDMSGGGGGRWCVTGAKETVSERRDFAIIGGAHETVRPCFLPNWKLDSTGIEANNLKGEAARGALLPPVSLKGRGVNREEGKGGQGLSVGSLVAPGIRDVTPVPDCMSWRHGQAQQCPSVNFLRPFTRLSASYVDLSNGTCTAIYNTAGPVCPAMEPEAE
ncbi:hypothetical protein BaRGS_00029090, partial [Batillaria attramentaria]